VPVGKVKVRVQPFVTAELLLVIVYWPVYPVPQLVTVWKDALSGPADASLAATTAALAVRSTAAVVLVIRALGVRAPRSRTAARPWPRIGSKRCRPAEGGR
jgi:hypothetical protein